MTQQNSTGMEPAGKKIFGQTCANMEKHNNEGNADGMKQGVQPKTQPDVGWQ